jgi:PAS domain S-box-containing protein
MTKQSGKQKSSEEYETEIERLRRLLEEERYQHQEAKETLEAIRTGAVDGLVRSGPEGEQVFILKGSDQPYRNLVEKMNEGAILISENGTILYANFGFAGLIDAPLDKVIGTHVSDWVSARSVEVLNDIISRNTKNGRRVFEIAFQTTKQKFIPTQVSLSKISFGTVNASALVVTDLTKHMEGEVKRYTTELETEIIQRRKAEEALRMSEHRFKSLAENAPDVIMRFDTNLRIMYLNPQVEVATGITAERYLGKTNEEMSMPDDLIKTWNELFHRAAESKKAQEIEFIFPSPNGNRAYDLRVVPEYSEDGSLTSFLGISRDITERKKVEKELHEAQNKLEDYAANLEKLVEERTKQLKDAERLAAIGQVAGMVGHDIRNPLQAIVGELYVVRESMKQAPQETITNETMESLSFIEQQVDYINKIVVDLQDFSKPLTPNFTDEELCSFIDDALKGVAIPDNIETKLICDQKIPAVKLDKTFMTRVLTNLATNAIQAMPNGGKLTVKGSREDKVVMIVVEDTGVGISDEVKSKLFTPMFTTKAKGQGFGLPVVKRLVEAQGGSISFESEVGKGTQFIVKLPT